MANYFLDTEFIEGFHKPLFGKRRHFIDLISIGIVCEDGREYYAISNEVDVAKIWNMEDDFVLNKVVKPMFSRYIKDDWDRFKYMPGYCGLDGNFTLRNLKRFFKNAGKSNKQIAKEIKEFVFDKQIDFKNNKPVFNNPEFYAYYADYDWVLFCSLFGRMIDLPTGYPMYCRDLKQMLDEKVKHMMSTGYSKWNDYKGMDAILSEHSFEDCLKRFKSASNYPKQKNEHNAFDDAKWNYELYKFLQKK